MPASFLLLGSAALMGADPCCAPAPISCPDACAPKIDCNPCGSPLFSRPLFKGTLLAKLKSLKSSSSCGRAVAPACDPCTIAAPSPGCALPAMPVSPAHPAQPAAPVKEAPKEMPKPEAPKTPDNKKTTFAPIAPSILVPATSANAIPGRNTGGAY